jgi:hypothetical protein
MDLIADAFIEVVEDVKVDNDDISILRLLLIEFSVF